MEGCARLAEVDGHIDRHMLESSEERVTVVELGTQREVVADHNLAHFRSHKNVLPVRGSDLLNRNAEGGRLLPIPLALRLLQNHQLVQVEAWLLVFFYPAHVIQASEASRQVELEEVL